MQITDRRTEYEARKRDFIKQYSHYPDYDYSRYYGEEEAAYIDARSAYYWWEEQDTDQEWTDKWIKKMEKLTNFKNQSF